MKELKPSPQLDGTLEENKRAIQRIIDSLTEEEIAEAMSDKYDIPILELHMGKIQGIIIRII